MNKIVILKPFCRYLLSPLWGYLWTVDGIIQEQKYILLSWHHPRRLWGTFANTQMNWFLILLIVMKGFLFIMTNGTFYTFLIIISVEDLLILSLQTQFFILGFELSNARKFLTSCLLSPLYWDRNPFPSSLPVRTTKDVSDGILTIIHLPKELQHLLENIIYKVKFSCHSCWYNLISHENRFWKFIQLVKSNKTKNIPENSLVWHPVPFMMHIR